MADVLPVLAVDRNRRNLELLTQCLDREGCLLQSASSLEEFDAFLTGKTPIGLVLVDVAGFDPRIWERCERLNRNDVPWFLLSPENRQVTFRAEAVQHGARSILVKPLSPGPLIALVQSVLEKHP